MHVQLCHKFSFSVIIISLMCFTSCIRYRIDTENLFYEETNEMPSPHSDYQIEAHSHWLYQYVPRHRSQIAWYDLCHWTSWALFGNDDDGIFGEDSVRAYKCNQAASCAKAAQWNLRNPLHNFCFYVIGSAHRTNSELTLLKLAEGRLNALNYSPNPGVVFPSENSCFFLALHGGKPFISLRLRYSQNWRGDFYFGWRERGNFGIKFLPFCQIKRT